jgi:hypothetical protein
MSRRSYPHGRHRLEVDDAIRRLDVKLQEAMSSYEENRRKRALSVADDGSTSSGDAKRLKVSHESTESAVPRTHKPVNPSILSNFDFSTLPNHILAEIAIESLRLLNEEQLQAAIEVCGQYT